MRGIHKGNCLFLIALFMIKIILPIVVTSMDFDTFNVNKIKKTNKYNYDGSKRTI